MDRFEQIISIKRALRDQAKFESQDKMEISPNPCWEGYEPIGLKEDGSPNCVPIKEEQKKQVDFADYPWDQCIADQIKTYGDEETAKKVCGAIKAQNMREDFIIPSPESGEDQQTYVSRCIAAIYDEYGQEQGYAICKSKWDEK
jgi:hypothetical protein